VGQGRGVVSAIGKKSDGVSLHGGMDETSLMLYLRPNLVAPDY
jgi:creatinine amidohydrolase/Fe(II)-dependent formamide hydrolase-like protein